MRGRMALAAMAAAVGGIVGLSPMAQAGERVTLTGEVWVDNWFTLWANGQKVIEDSTPYKTERSFNAERFTFEAEMPVTLAFEFRDFMENETGLEYIGSRRQQMGDGGAIAQFKDAGGKLIAVTDEAWRCLVRQHAPVDERCEKERDPKVDTGACAQEVAAVGDDWTSPTFDDSAWPTATEHSARDVGPKDGYDEIRWDRSAQLIWAPDLKRDNIVLCRLTADN